jgi:hypothetical protein
VRPKAKCGTAEPARRRHSIRALITPSNDWKPLMSVAPMGLGYIVFALGDASVRRGFCQSAHRQRVAAAARCTHFVAQEKGLAGVTGDVRCEEKTGYQGDAGVEGSNHSGTVCRDRSLDAQ